MSIRLTPKRRQILDVLKQHHGALSAKAIHQELPSLDLATIYRNLNLFVAEKMISEIHLSKDEVLFEYQKQPHHHAVCSDCSEVIHFSASDKDIIKLLNLPKNFSVEELEVTVRGKHT